MGHYSLQTRVLSRAGYRTRVNTEKTHTVRSKMYLYCLVLEGPQKVNDFTHLTVCKYHLSINYPHFDDL